MEIKNLALLSASILIGLLLRFTNLTAKPPWTDEFATLVFSLGNNYDSVPLNQVISREVLLSPLRYNHSASGIDVFHLLIDKDNHPPLYFILSHWWLNLFPRGDEYVSLWAMRSLPALFGVLAILLAYFLGNLTFQSRKAGHLSAMMMAVSPYGVFLSQEARHYSWGIVLVMLSLICFVAAGHYLNEQKYLPLTPVSGWIIINGLGLLSHYFFSLTLLAQAIVLGCLLIYQIRRGRVKYNLWIRMSWVWLGTAIIALSWWVTWFPRHHGNGMTAWIQGNYSNIIALISPVFQLLAAWITMIALLPVEADSLAIIILSVLLMLWFFWRVIPPLKKGLIALLRQSSSPLPISMLVGFIAASIALFFAITYGLGLDITRGARYSFVYFPAVIIIVGGCLAFNWENGRKSLVILVLLMGLISSLTVVFNLGYRKYYLSDRFVQTLAQNSQYPILLATTHQSLVQVGEMMGIAWVIQEQFSFLKPRYILISEEPRLEATLRLSKIVSEFPHPLEVWAVNFNGDVNLPGCFTDTSQLPHVNGYGYKKYLCK
ncbi:MAG: hypothetical protein N5P05_002514 [Chroococcopsis gigantea SAG 12.99]|nr:hypothetical protein [Chroococcopsis gigantea SAG 12.99]